MLAIQNSSKSNPKCTPHLLPARLHHDGPISDTERYWKPETTADGQPQAYFRGRHLHGTTFSLPANYTGAVLNITDKDLLSSTTNSASNGGETGDGEEEDEEDEMDDVEVEVKVAEKVGEFEEVVVWGHGGVVDERSDVYARAVGEWIGFSEAMHCEDDDEGQDVEGKGKEGKKSG